MSTPTDIPRSVPTEPAPNAEPTETVVKTALRLERAKTFVKSAFTKVGVPVLIGSAAAYVVTRTKDESDTDTNETTSTDTDSEFQE